MARKAGWPSHWVCDYAHLGVADFAEGWRRSISVGLAGNDRDTEGLAHQGFAAPAQKGPRRGVEVCDPAIVADDDHAVGVAFDEEPEPSLAGLRCLEGLKGF